MRERGKVILMGAGPGDPELITVKAAGYLAAADVVICDRLVSSLLLDTYMSPTATLIFAGKEGYAPGSVPQTDINELLLQHYGEDKLVVRLKGGDTAFFSNILDELTTLTNNRIPYEIVPGITAASGASACCGIPLTARGYADAVRLITLVSKEEATTAYWKELALTNDTLVAYMSASFLQPLAAQLSQYNTDPRKKIAVIEQATTPFQRVTVFDAARFPPQGHRWQTPTLVIIGAVVSLYENFRWQENSNMTRAYFRPAVRNTVAQRISNIV